MIRCGALFAGNVCTLPETHITYSKHKCEYVDGGAIGWPDNFTTGYETDDHPVGPIEYP